MKKSVLTVGLVFFAATFLGCRDADPEPDTVVIEKEVVNDDQQNKQDEGLLEEAAAEVDKEIDQEVSEEIDKIGDNN